MKDVEWIMIFVLIACWNNNVVYALSQIIHIIKVNFTFLLLLP